MSQIYRIPYSDKYHGLKNQGATCYLNSVLQVLFMTKEFREAVERYRGDAGCLEHHLKDLFKDLHTYAADTRKITKKLGINNVYEQRDAAEYLEKILLLTDLESKASMVFRAELTHENKCLECHTVTNTGGPCWHLPLALDSCSESYSVADGIENFFSTSEVSGENQMYCDKCDDKANAALTSVMTRHPDVLVLLLKRFEFDYAYMAYVKVNCLVDVPFTLQIPKNETFTYELYAVVHHFGDLKGGHYTADIKSDEDNQWYQFNDRSVSGPFHIDTTVLSRSPYLLFYRKERTDAADTCNGVTRGDLQEDTETGDIDMGEETSQHGDPNKEDEDGKTRDEQLEKKRKTSPRMTGAREDSVRIIYEGQEVKRKQQHVGQRDGIDDRQNSAEQEVSDMTREKQDKGQGQRRDSEHIPNPDALQKGKGGKGEPGKCSETIEEDRRPDSGTKSGSVSEDCAGMQEIQKGSSRSRRRCVNDTRVFKLFANLSMKPRRKVLKGRIKTDNTTDSSAKGTNSSRKRWKRNKSDMNGKKGRKIGKCLFGCIDKSPDL